MLLVIQNRLFPHTLTPLNDVNEPVGKCMHTDDVDMLEHIMLVYLFVLRLNVPVNNFSVMSGRSQRFLGLTSTVGS